MEKVFSNQISNKSLTPQVHKEVRQENSKIKTQCKKKQMANRHFSIDYNLLVIQNMCSVSQINREMQSKTHQLIPLWMIIMDECWWECVGRKTLYSDCVDMIWVGH